MKTLLFCRWLGVCALAALFAGCGETHALPVTSPFASAIAHPDRASSWMTADAKASTLLYVSDQGTMDVYAFSYPQGKLKGTLTGFKEPAGECSDKSGNVFITNAFAQNVVEYAHGGSSPVATLSDAGEFPSGCSIDGATGNLAVANFCSGTSGCSGPGGLSIYANAQGTPKEYSTARISNAYFCGYDDEGNLFVDGTHGAKFAFAELRAGMGKVTNVTLDQHIQTPGNVQWDGSHVAVGDNATFTVYQFTIIGKKGTRTGKTSLGGAKAIVQFWIQGAKIIAPNDLGSSLGDVLFWNYPAGGSVTRTLSGLTDPVGATVSVAP